MKLSSFDYLCRRSSQSSSFGFHLFIFIFFVFTVLLADSFLGPVTLGPEISY